MTKVEIRLSLARPLDETLLTRLAAAHGVYGILRIQVRTAPESLLVEYDATRLDATGVLDVLRRSGIPVSAVSE